MTEETLRQLMQQSAPGEEEALREQGRRLREAAATLDELPLHLAEPAGVYRVDDGADGE